MSKKYTIVTHSSGFHTDDVFAVATLLLHLGEENCEVVRTREREKIDAADYVVDVGFEYDPEKNRFDHHQEGRAGARENGIIYASFGLVWKEFGAQVAGAQEVADEVERVLVQPIDAYDNGQQMFGALVWGDILPYTINELVDAFLPTRIEDEVVTYDSFMSLVHLAQQIIEREIVWAKARISDRKEIQKIYEHTKDKRMLVFDVHYEWRDAIKKYPEPVFVIGPRFKEGKAVYWNAVTVQDNYPISFEMRKAFPKSWRGKQGKEVQEISGVSDAIFCHDSGFMAAAKSKEGALKLAKLALES